MNDVKERPILFSGLMVKALMENRKNQTRRVVNTDPGFLNYAKHQWIDENGAWLPTTPSGKVGLAPAVPCPYGKPGDRLWVREAWQTWAEYDNISPSEIPQNPSAILYIADRPDTLWDSRKRASIHMPRWASRITLEIVSVRVERVQEILRIDARGEGFPWTPLGKEETEDPYRWYELLWDSINGDKPGASWDANPFVWAVKFRRVANDGTPTP